MTEHHRTRVRPRKPEPWQADLHDARGKPLAAGDPIQRWDTGRCGVVHTIVRERLRVRWEDREYVGEHASKENPANVIRRRGL